MIAFSGSRANTVATGEITGHSKIATYFIDLSRRIYRGTQLVGITSLGKMAGKTVMCKDAPPARVTRTVRHSTILAFPVLARLVATRNC